MCRSTSDGGRRCTGSSADRIRALGTARKAVERAGRAVNQARADGNPDAVAAAEAKLTTAQQRLDDTRAAHPDTPSTEDQRGHDTASTDTAAAALPAAGSWGNTPQGRMMRTFLAHREDARAGRADLDSTPLPRREPEPEPEPAPPSETRQRPATAPRQTPPTRVVINAEEVHTTGDTTPPAGDGGSIVFGFVNTDHPDDAPTTYGFVNGTPTHGPHAGDVTNPSSRHQEP